MKRLLTIGHSYVVALNRRLAHELAVAGEGRWEVTAVAPASLPGDLRPIVVEAAPGERCRTIALPVRAGAWPHLRTYAGLGAVLRQPFDVVHCWEEPYVAAGWQVARATPSPTPFVFATFQNIRKDYPPPFAWMERQTLRRSAGWIAFGRTAHAALGSDALYARKPSAVIGPGVDVERFAPDAAVRASVRHALGWDERVPVIGFLGRFVPEKGLAILAEVLDRLESPWRALFVGGGPGQPALEALAATRPERIRVVTGVAHDAVPRYLNAMDVLCAPSQTTRRWREQFGRMLIEAMACGVPVLASDSGEMPHVVGGAGVILPERDTAAWRAALDDLLRDPRRRAALGAAGRARVVAEFAWPAVAARHLAFLEEVRR